MLRACCGIQQIVECRLERGVTELESGTLGACRQHARTGRQERGELAKHHAQSELRDRYERGTVKDSRKNR